jgi:hypothetical protein
MARISAALVAEHSTSQGAGADAARPPASTTSWTAKWNSGCIGSRNGFYHAIKAHVAARLRMATIFRMAGI